MTHPATGPISPEELQRIASLPYGHAQHELQKHDPLWGKLSRDDDAPAKPIKWKVFVTQQVTMEAYAHVEAATEEDALEIARTMREGEFSWDFNSSDSVEVQYAEPE
jgi:hypothetical protein